MYVYMYTCMYVYVNVYMYELRSCISRAVIIAYWEHEDKRAFAYIYPYTILWLLDRS